MLSFRMSALVLCVALTGCVDGEPDDGAIRDSLKRVQTLWQAQERQAREARTPPGRRGLPNIDLAFEARVHLRVDGVRKVGCRPAEERMGYVCVIEVTAAVGGAPAVARRLESRFVSGLTGWLAVDLKPLPEPARDAIAAAAETQEKSRQR